MNTEDRMHKLRNGSDTAKWAANRIAELEAQLKAVLEDNTKLAQVMHSHNLEQQAKGIEDAVTKLERPDVAFAPCLILNDDLLDFSGELRNQAKALKECM